MRILHLLDIPWHSGLADYALHLAAAERDAGHEVWLAVRPQSAAAAEADRLRIPRIPWTRPRDLARLRRFLQEHRIEVRNAHTGAAHTAAALASVGLEPEGRPAERSVLIRTRADARPVRRRPFAGWLLRRTAFYVGATERIRRQFINELRLPADRVRVIYPAVHGPAEAAPPSWSASDTAPIIALVGRLDPVKGHVVFLEAAARIRRARPDARFTVVGREEHLSIAALREQGLRLGLDAGLTFTGAVPSVTPWMEGATLGVIPSIGSEAVSRVALEWMAHARPVVASSVGGLPELIEDGRSGLLVPPGRADALAEAVLDLLSDPARLQRMGQEARVCAASRFAPERLRRETVALYEEARCRS